MNEWKIDIPPYFHRDSRHPIHINHTRHDGPCCSKTLYSGFNPDGLYCMVYYSKVPKEIITVVRLLHMAAQNG